ncbi:hypothetical protein V6N11_000885 [Hibiscus sabdariffa]|uniref:allene-oxide cyclase n=2 Tax=Hibiscus sabdariffa TaxID=183260 RepID=A0ABR2RYW3_9ROSI
MEIVEFLGEFCGDKVAGVSKCTDLSPQDCFGCGNKVMDTLTGKVQELHVYEMNERDRGSPAYLLLSQKSVNSLGNRLKGIGELPVELLCKPVQPHPAVEAAPPAKACEPHATISNFTN